MEEYLFLERSAASEDIQLSVAHVELLCNLNDQVNYLLLVVYGQVVLQLVWLKQDSQAYVVVRIKLRKWLVSNMFIVIP